MFAAVIFDPILIRISRELAVFNLGENLLGVDFPKTLYVLVEPFQTHFNVGISLLCLLLAGLLLCIFSSLKQGTDMKNYQGETCLSDFLSICQFNIDDVDFFILVVVFVCISQSDIVANLKT